jgi:hypothetical protein
MLFNPFNYSLLKSSILSPGVPSPVLTHNDESVVGTMNLTTLRALVDELRIPLLEARNRVAHIGWKLENTTAALYYSFQLPPEHRRPYAALDYILENDQLQRIHSKLENKKLPMCFRAQGFDDWQRELIFAANMIFHGQDALIISDNEDDQVYREVVVEYSARSGAISTMGRYEYAVREWVRASNLAPHLKVPRGALFLNSTAFAPQVATSSRRPGLGMESTHSATRRW